MNSDGILIIFLVKPNHKSQQLLMLLLRGNDSIRSPSVLRLDPITNALLLDSFRSVIIFIDH